jgi:hypothetical protein
LARLGTPVNLKPFHWVKWLSGISA